MPEIIEGKPYQVGGVKIAIVVSRYNDSITQKLLDGAVETLLENQIDDDNIQVAWVPGAWELSVVAERFASHQNIDAVIALGAVIRGETTHDQYINQQVSLSLGAVAIEYKKPVLFGLLTCNNLEQAINRSGGNQGNKGKECAEAALEMITLLKKVS